MAITHGAAVRTAIANAVAAQADAGAGPAVLKVKDGTTVLSTHTMSDPAFSAASGPTIAANAIGDATVAASGTPDNFTIEDSSGNVIINGSAGDVGSGADLEVSPHQGC